MISSETPYKLAEIIRYTWPNLYHYESMYTPEGYFGDPPDAKCPHCGESGKSCSHVNSLSRAWARDACAKKNSKSS